MHCIVYIVLRMLLETYSFVPWAPGSYQAARWLERRYWRCCKVVHRKRHGVCLELDLGRFIDFEVFYGACFERALVSAVKPLVKPGMTVVDVGANSGYYTMLFARLVGEQGHVWAFEPTDWGVRVLERQISLNSFNNIHLVKTALVASNKPNDSPIEFDPYYPLFSDRYKHRASSEVVPYTSIDATLVNLTTSVDLIKIDVDGPELDILRGAIQTIQKFHPIIVLEVGHYTYRRAGSSVDELVAWLHEQAYEIFYETDLSLLKTAADVISCMPDPEQNTINVICIPLTGKR